MDAQQVVVFQLLETFKASYLSKDLKTCQNVLCQLKEMVDQKTQLEDFRNMPFDGEWIDQTNWDEYTATIIDKEANKEDEVDGEKEDAKEDEVDEKEEDAKEDEEKGDAKEDEDEEEEEDDSDAEEDEEYVVDEEEDDDSGEEEDDEIQQPLRRSSRIKKVNAY
ncbi:hypothetical protein Bca101_064255 [Brassica carinata]